MYNVCSGSKGFLKLHTSFPLNTQCSVLDNRWDFKAHSMPNCPICTFVHAFELRLKCILKVLSGCFKSTSPCLFWHPYGWLMDEKTFVLVGRTFVLKLCFSQTIILSSNSKNAIKFYVLYSRDISLGFFSVKLLTMF